MIVRVFPRKTNATPIDDGVRFSDPCLFDEADEVRVSVTWTWDKPRGEELAESWRAVTSRVYIGGPAYDDPGGEFEPGMYLRNGYIITSRGCPNKCWFCYVPKREGSIRELVIKDGYNILDSNLLACSDVHIKKVFEMLKRQKQKAKFTGGLEPARLTEWVVKLLQEIKPKSIYLAYDTPDDFEHLVNASKLLKRYNLITKNNHIVFCYVLIGYRSDTLERANERLLSVARLGVAPMAMLYNRRKEKEWRILQREWANKIIVFSKMRKFI